VCHQASRVRTKGITELDEPGTGRGGTIQHVSLIKMSLHDDPEAFIDLFEKTAEACGW